MARELNRELFGGSSEQEPAPGSVPATASPSYAKSEELRVLHLHIENLSKRMKDFESRTETLNTRVEDMLAQNKQRFERVQGGFQRHAEMFQTGINDVNNKIAKVVSRVNERKVEENMIKEMVERQANLVQSFEVRMNQLQKIISEQELQLMNARTELREALQELARLKKY